MKTGRATCDCAACLAVLLIFLFTQSKGLAEPWIDIMTISTRAATRHRFSLRDLDNLRPDSPDSLIDFAVNRLAGFDCDLSQSILVPPRQRIALIEIVSRHWYRHGRLRRVDVHEVGHDGKHVCRLTIACDQWDFHDVVRLLIRRAADQNFLAAAQPLLGPDGAGMVLRPDAEATARLQLLFGPEVRAMHTDCAGDRFPGQLICGVFGEELPA